MQKQADLFWCYVHPHIRKLMGISRHYTLSEGDAEDLVQETLLRAWKDFSSPVHRDYRPGWLFVILRHVAVDWARGRSRRIRSLTEIQAEFTEASTADLTEPLHPLPAMSEEQFREFLDDRIVVALDALDVSFREVILLSVVGELNYREIAEVLDCPLGTVMSRMARARRTLRERLAEFSRDPGRKRDRTGGEMETA